MIEINYWAIIIVTILQFVVSAFWYGPYLFGKTWMKLAGVHDLDPQKIKAMQKAMFPAYLIQFVIAFFTNFVLFYFIKLIPDHGSMDVSLWAWAGFVVMTIAGGALWKTGSNDTKWKKFLIPAGNQLIGFIIAGYIFGMY